MDAVDPSKEEDKTTLVPSRGGPGPYVPEQMLGVVVQTAGPVLDYFDWGGNKRF